MIQGTIFLCLYSVSKEIFFFFLYLNIYINLKMKKWKILYSLYIINNISKKNGHQATLFIDTEYN